MNGNDAVDLATLTLTDAGHWVGSEFTRPDDEHPVTLVLEAVAPGLARGVPGAREPFAMVFVGPAAPRLTQGIHRLERPGATLELFLVPISGDDDSTRYEAVFG